MATIDRCFKSDDFDELLTELYRRSVAMNNYRMSAGVGRSEGFGTIRRMSYRPWIGRATWQRIRLYKLLCDFANKHGIENWDGIQVNQDYQTAAHYDSHNVGESYIVGFGPYFGGNLVIGDKQYDIRHTGYRFNGSKFLHSTSPFCGARFSIVFFKIAIPEKFGTYSVKAEVIEENQQMLLRIVDSYDDSVIVLNRRGKIERTEKPGKKMEWAGLLTSLKSRAISVSAE
jgi:hypothetical protein